MKHNGTRSPEAILAEIERTRSDMDVTLHAIEERLTPGQLMDQSLDYLRNSGGREFLTNLNTSVRNNPLPATLVGIGLVWLMAANKNPPRASYATTPGEGLSERAGQLKDRAGEMKDRAAETAASARDRLSSAALSARERVADTAQRTRDRWNRTSTAARHQVDRARDGYQHLLQEQPLALGALGIGLGALLAASAPRTRREDQLMGEASDRLKDSLAETGEAQMEKARGMIAAAKDARTKDGQDRDHGAATAKADASDASRPQSSRPDSSQPGSTTLKTEPFAG